MNRSSGKNATPDPVSRETALGLLAANAAVPGVGTFLAGRKVSGAIQTIAGVIGMGLTLVYGLKMIGWMLANWGPLQDPDGDPVESLTSIWRVAKLPLLGIALFVFSWAWAMWDSFVLLKRFPKDKSKPPVL